MRARAISLIAIVAVAAAGCGFGRSPIVQRVGAPPYTIGSGKVATVIRQAGPFHAVSAANGLDVRVVRGEPSSLKVTADDNLTDLITTDVRDGVLVVTVKGGLETHLQLAVAVTASAAIDTLQADTGAALSLEGNTATTMTVTAGAGAIVKVVSSRATHLSLTASGAWTDLGGLEAASADVTLDGSTAYVNVSESISGACTRGSTLHMGVKPASYSVTSDSSSSLLTD